MEAEESRAHHYLSSLTAEPLRRILEVNLLTNHLVDIISKESSGLDTMIDSDKIDDLARLYRLYSMVPQGIPCLRNALKDSIVRRGNEINQSSLGIDAETELVDPPPSDRKGKGKAVPSAQLHLNAALKWVQDVLDLKDKFDAVWLNAFSSDRDLESGLNEVCLCLPFCAHRIISL